MKLAEMSEEDRAKMLAEMSEEDKEKMVELLTEQLRLLTEHKRLLEQQEDDDYFDGIDMDWEDETWSNFYLTASEIKKREGFSLGVIRRAILTP